MTLADHLKLLGAAGLAFALASGPASAQTDKDESEEQIHESITDSSDETRPRIDETDPMQHEPEDEGAGMGKKVPLSEAVDPEEATEEGTTGGADQGSDDGASDAGGDEGAGGDAADASADDVVAKVNGKDLTLGELIALRRDLPAQYQQLPDEVLTQGLTEQMVDQMLLEAAGREAGLPERKDVALSLRNQERAVIADAYLQSQLAGVVTADALRQAYEEKYVNVEPTEEIRAAHILVDSEEKAQELREQLDEGADFAELAAEHGIDGTAARGGDLGWFAKSDMVPAFGEAAFALEPGELGGPVESPFGWHVIRVDERRERPAPDFAEVEAALLQQVTQDAQQKIMEKLRSDAEISFPAQIPPAAIRQDSLIQPDG